jgi:hypothetical protein
MDVKAFYTRINAADIATFGKPYIGQDMFMVLTTPPDNLGEEFTFTFTMTFEDGTTKSLTYGPCIPQFM